MASLPPLASMALGGDSCSSGSREMGSLTASSESLVSHQGWTKQCSVGTSQSLALCLLCHPGSVLALTGSRGALGPWLLFCGILLPQLGVEENLPVKWAMTVWEGRGTFVGRVCWCEGEGAGRWQGHTTRPCAALKWIPQSSALSSPAPGWTVVGRV